MFRPNKVYQVFIKSSEVFILYILCIICASSLAILFIYALIPEFLYKYDVATYIILALSSLSLVILLPSSIISWLRNKNLYYEPENYFILTTFALLTSILFGIISFSLYYLDSSTYKVDDYLFNEIKSNLITANEDQISNSRKTIYLIDEWIPYIKNCKEKIIFVDEDHSFLNSSYDYIYKLDKLDITLTETNTRIDRGINMKMYSAEFKKDSSTLTINSFHRIISPYLIPLNLKDNPKLKIAYLLSQRKTWEQKYVLKQSLKNRKKLQNSNFNLPMSYFLYDSTLYMLGNNTGYFKPYSIQGRALEIFKTLFKFFYLSYFVSFLVKKFSVKND